jgi:hypothetical protein
MLSSGANVIIWDKMLSSGAYVTMVSSGAYVIIWCYHVMLSSGMITHPIFIFPENFTHSIINDKLFVPIINFTVHIHQYFKGIVCYEKNIFFDYAKNLNSAFCVWLMVFTIYICLWRKFKTKFLLAPSNHVLIQKILPVTLIRKLVPTFR